MATRIFAVDLGAWSVKLAIASPGIRGATLLDVAERLVPPGDEPVELRARRVLAAMIDELRLRDETGYIGVYGDQVFTQILDFGFKNLRRAELDKAVGGELEGVVPVDLEDMVYCFEPIPPPPAPVGNVAMPLVEPRGRVAPPVEGMRVLSYAMRRERAEQLIALGGECHFNVRGVLPCAGAAVRIVDRTPSLAKARQDGAVAVIDIGHERTDVIVVHAGKAVFSRSIPRAGKQLTEAIARHWKLDFASAERAKHADGFVASAAEPATSEAWARIHQVTVGELVPFARDLRQTLAACRARTGFMPIAAVVVGGGGRLRGMGSFLAEQLAVPAWRLSADDVTALAGPKIGAERAATLPVDAAALTVGMAYDAAGGRPLFDLRSGALAVRVDLSFLRAKAVPLGVAALAIAACAAGAAFADLYKLKKAEATLTQRLATESAEHFGSAKTVDEILGNGESGGVAATVSPLPKQTAYDLLLDISAHVPPKDKVTIDIQHLDIDTDKVEIVGTAMKADEIDLLVTELKKIPCFTSIPQPATALAGELQSFTLNISAQCM